MRMVRHTLLILALALPAAADERSDRGFSLMEDGARLLLRSLADDMRPQLDEFRQGMGEAMATMGPALKDLMARVGDLRNYHPPEVLPNGDIILRRKAPAERAAPGGGIEL